MKPAGPEVRREERDLPHAHDRLRCLRVRLQIPAGARAAVVLVHGYLSGRELYFHPALEADLVAAGIATFAADLSGAGHGPRGPFTEREAFAQNRYSFELEDVLELWEFARGEMGIEAGAIGLFGHSRGAAVALVAAAEIARRGMAVGALVLWAAPAHVGRYRPERLEAWRRDGVLDVEWPDGSKVYLPREVLSDFEPLPAAFELLARAREVAAPTLLVRGARDRAVGPEETAALAQALPRAEVLEVPGAGHNFGARPLRAEPTDQRLAAALGSTRAWYLAHLGKT